jgi:hypothetical protein
MQTELNDPGGAARCLLVLHRDLDGLSSVGQTPTSSLLSPETHRAQIKLVTAFPFAASSPQSLLLPFSDT